MQICQFLRGGYGNSLQYFAWRIPMDRGAWWNTAYSVRKSQTRLKQCNNNRKKVHNKWNSLNHPETIPPHPGQWKNCLSQNPSLRCQKG